MYRKCSNKYLSTNSEKERATANVKKVSDIVPGTIHWIRHLFHLWCLTQPAIIYHPFNMILHEAVVYVIYHHYSPCAHISDQIPALSPLTYEINILLMTQLLLIITDITYTVYGRDINFHSFAKLTTNGGHAVRIDLHSPKHFSETISLQQCEIVWDIWIKKCPYHRLNNMFPWGLLGHPLLGRFADGFHTMVRSRHLSVIHLIFVKWLSLCRRHVRRVGEG